MPGLTYGVLGNEYHYKRKNSTDTKAAAKAPGVGTLFVGILNKPSAPAYEQEGGPAMKIFYTDKIFFNGRPLVVANTFERATYAASLVTASYSKEEFNTDFEKAIGDIKSKKT